MVSFVEIDGRRFEFSHATLELYHCGSKEADWNLELLLEHDDDDQAHRMWLAGTVRPSPRTADDLDGLRLTIEGRDLDTLFEGLLGLPITTWPGGTDACQAWFSATTSHEGVLGVNLVSAFEFDWDRELDPPDATYNEPRSARLEISAQVRGMHRGDLPETR